MKKISILILVFSIFITSYLKARNLAVPPQNNIAINILVKDLKSNHPSIKMRAFVELYKLSFKEKNLKLMSDAGAIEALNYFRIGNLRSPFIFLADDLRKKILDNLTLQNEKTS